MTGARRVTRRDSRGHRWTEAGVERVAIKIVRDLSPGWARRKISRRTRLHDDLGWDEWYMLRLTKPVRARLHEPLDDRVVLRLRTVGDLVGCVWGGMDAT